MQGGPHTPFSQERHEQQPAPQSWLSLAQVVQTWLAHVPLQHSEKFTQAWPPGLQPGSVDVEEEPLGLSLGILSLSGAAHGG